MIKNAKVRRVSRPQLREFLLDVGYRRDLIRVEQNDSGVDFATGYGQLPMTARNAGVVVVNDVADVLRALRQTGASLAIALTSTREEAWMAAAEHPRKLEVFDRAAIDPDSIHRAKVLGRFDSSYQLDFVDIGLLSDIERDQGSQLQRLLERLVAELRDGTVLPDHESHEVLVLAFWILAAKMLRDHDVPAFVNLSTAPREVLRAVAKHYGGAIPLLASNPKWKARIAQAIDLAWRAEAMRDIGAEAIGHVYESSLIADQVRYDLGIHSTPPYLVEYILGRLEHVIRAFSIERRVVAEPACGHGGFLVAALQMLVADLPPHIDRHSYLRERLRGIEIDLVAKEMARLSLTLADAPHPDGWDLRRSNMFLGEDLTHVLTGATIILSNPPFEKFTKDDRERIEIESHRPCEYSKSSELLRRILDQAEDDAVIGIVMPRAFLVSPKRSDVDLRQHMLRRCQIFEICLFPAGVFKFAEQECAVILAQRNARGTQDRSTICMRGVREESIEAFRARGEVSYEDFVPGAMLVRDSRLFVPPLRRIWESRVWTRLEEVAEVVQGLSHKAGVAEPVRSRSGPHHVLAVTGTQAAGDLPNTASLPYCYMDIRKESIARPRGGLPTNQPQVIVNYSPRSRGPWRIAAYVDPHGAALPSTRVAVRPRGQLGVEVLWALCNSVVANAYVYLHSSKRHTHVGIYRSIPLPAITPTLIRVVTKLVQQIFNLGARKDSVRKRHQMRQLQERLDVILLSAYGFFGPTEAAIRQLFDDFTRPGVVDGATTIPGDARLPAYLALSNVEPLLPEPQSDLVLIPDLDAEIESGRSELAKLDQIDPAQDSRINARIQYVENTLSLLEHRAAAIGIADEEPS